MRKDCRLLIACVLLMVGCHSTKPWPFRSLASRAGSNHTYSPISQNELAEINEEGDLSENLQTALPATDTDPLQTSDESGSKSDTLLTSFTSSPPQEDSKAASPEGAEATTTTETKAVQNAKDDPATGGSQNSSSKASAGIAKPDLTNTANEQAILYDEVVGSVYQSYPLLESALFSRNIAIGQQVGASGAFDTKLKGASENGPQGFYQTYRQSIGVVQPTYWGGEVFAGYRIGRGDFQPWYLERQTNDAGEFKAGVQVPLARNRTIDARRAELWKAGISRTMAEPEIQAQLIGFVQEASYSYWDWVAAGEYHEIATSILRLAEDRTSRIEAQVKAGLVDPPELTDNLRLVAIRQAKVADTRRKLEQTAAKLSVYLRDAAGNPMLPADSQLPGFPEPTPVDDDMLDSNISMALSRRPELRVLDLMRQQTQVDYTEACNQMQPELNAVLWGSQDVGEPTSSKRDKSPYESEASMYLDVPMQRRKARGKIAELQGKLAQLSAKRRITADKIGVDVRAAHAALKSAWEQVKETNEALKYAEDLAARERRNQDAGASDLLKVALREQYAVESAEKNVDALKLYFDAQADFRAAMAEDNLTNAP